MNPAFKIGIIGVGNLGGTLGVHFFKAGHQVTFGSKNPGQLTDPVTEAGKKISVGNTAKTFDFGLV